MNEKDLKDLKKTLNTKRAKCIGKVTVTIGLAAVMVFGSNKLCTKLNGDEPLNLVNRELTGGYVTEFMESANNGEESENIAVEFDENNLDNDTVAYYGEVDENISARTVVKYNILEYDDELFKEALKNNDLSIILPNLEQVEIIIRETSNDEDSYFNVSITYFDESKAVEKKTVSIPASSFYIVCLQVFVLSTILLRKDLKKFEREVESLKAAIDSKNKELEEEKEKVRKEEKVRTRTK